MAIRKAISDYIKARKNLIKAEKAFKENPSVENEKAMMDARSVIILVIAVIIAAKMYPSAISAIVDANTSGWGAGEAALWVIVPIILIAAFVMKVME